MNMPEKDAYVEVYLKTYSTVNIKHTKIHLLKESYFNKSKVQISTKTVDQFFNGFFCLFRKYSTI